MAGQQWIVVVPFTACCELTPCISMAFKSVVRCCTMHRPAFGCWSLAAVPQLEPWTGSTSAPRVTLHCPTATPASAASAAAAPRLRATSPTKVRRWPASRPMLIRILSFRWLTTGPAPRFASGSLPGRPPGSPTAFSSRQGQPGPGGTPA